MTAESWPALFGAGLWVLALLATVLRFLDSKRLDEYAPVPDADAPLVSVIIPARNEARNIGPCLRSLLASRYPALEVLVVDDHSSDGTGALAREIAAEDAARHGGRGRVRVLDGPPLPEGWFGKQWACHSGVAEARGPLLCFTDADTRHGPELLSRAVGAMRARGAALFTVAGAQETVTFWEKVVQPFVFAVLLSRYGGTESMSRSTRPLGKIANGQFLLTSRKAYATAGGHEAVRAHVAEDLRLAQHYTALGLPVHMVLAQDHFSTRMYTSLGEIRRGWGKNVYAAGRDTLPLGRVGRAIFPFIFPVPFLLPLIPPLALLLGWLGPLGPAALLFGSITTVASLLYWMGAYRYARVGALWGLTFPLAAAVFTGISIEAAWRGSRVAWKGRNYVSRPVH